ncbi:hypothetical protein MMUR_55640 [Mycolicibacterium murale]|jgi:uncharacterized integral membrane protein|uniref:Uncharacterized protein n=1 Tax=Mycolicibacterium murale TaxID=182220 RepID=A0A7I9WVJ3_9MYCO|nr:hypothetical protein [Mycolicibacterium murale]MCV7185709.1 hypothetical protein [Mycolicibacterium murale]GFG61428.1 hypothetical protein MMUR_55640 [Mycolicibacterium murale]
MTTAQNVPLVPEAALRPAGSGHVSLKGVLSALLFVLAMGAITAVVVAALAGETTVALIIAIVTGAVFAALIV